jgi:peptide/nickel transport system permease protein
MSRYVLQRIVSTVPVLFGASLIIFLLIHLVPGDPAIALAGPDAKPDELETIRRRMALDQPLYVQYWSYLTRVVQGDLGRSYYYKDDIGRLIARTMPATLELSFVALVISLAVAIPVGVLSATRRNSWIDHASMVAAVVGVSIPVFWLGIMLIYLFAVELDWLPASGRGGPLWTAEGLEHVILPAIALGSIMMASTTRLTRAAMLEVLQEDYVRTARAKGLREWAVVYGHGLRNALIPVVTNVGLQIGGLLAGSFLTETVFAWPGLGRLSVDAMFRRDYPLVQGTMLMVVFFYILVNLVVDLIYAVVDPRVSYR